MINTNKLKMSAISMKVEAERVLDTAAASKVQDRQHILNTFFTRTGLTIPDPEGSRLYAYNPLPPLKILSGTKAMPMRVVLKKEHEPSPSYTLFLWDAAQFPAFHQMLKEHLRCLDTDFLTYTRIKHTTGTSEKIREPAPFLRAYVKEGEVYTLENTTTKARFSARVSESSAGLETGSNTERKTGFVLWTEVRQLL